MNLGLSKQQSSKQISRPKADYNLMKMPSTHLVTKHKSL
jgi:hypothetical protein